jgi:O-6-methylguanine DNA methyltransferase
MNKAHPIGYYTTFSTPLGAFSVAVDASGATVASAFGDAGALGGQSARTYVEDAGRTAAARGQLREFFAGRRRSFDLPLRPSGTPFQRRVWSELEKIPYGGTVSYGELARKLGSSPRAVGGAVGANPLCPIVPCHRVIGSDGSLTGFGFGTALKRRLLESEGAWPRPGPRV